MAWFRGSAPRKVRSWVLPVRRLRSLVRTKAPPFPGLTCWNSTTWNRPSGRSSVMPFLRSLLLKATGAASYARSRRCRSGGRAGRRVAVAAEQAPTEGAGPLPEGRRLEHLEVVAEQHEVAEDAV